MLFHDLATTFVADRDRAIRDIRRRRSVSAWPSLMARVVARLTVSRRWRPRQAVGRSPRTLTRDLGGVTGVSAHPGDTHGQGAC
jgi:hypothetical protein